MASKYTRRGQKAKLEATSLARRAMKDADGSLTLDTLVSFSCNVSGHCCATDVMIGPYDVWRLVHSDAVASKLGIRLTSDLFGGEGAYLRLYLGSRSKLPQATIVNRPNEARGKPTCPFLTPIGDFVPVLGIRPRLTVDNKPMNGCGIHEARPTICRGYPFGRISGSNGSVKLIDWRDQCASCYSGYLGGAMVPLGQWLEDTGTAEGWRKTGVFLPLIEKLRKIESDNIRFVAGLVLFNFDIGWQRQGRTDAEIVSLRPATFEQHLECVSQFADAAIAFDHYAAIELLSRYGMQMTDDGEGHR